MSGGRLAGKVALVTGGASGIGRATCLEIAAEGGSLAVADINADGAKATAAMIGDGAASFSLDVSSEVDWQRVCQEVVVQFGNLDIVCNIAGIGTGGSIEDIDIDDWHAMVAVNLTGVVLGCKYGVKTITSSGGDGAIVNMSSIGGIVGPSDIAGYCATKGGVTTLTKSVAMHCAERGYAIRCVSIHPTFVDSEMLDPVAEASGTTRSKLVAGMSTLVPMKRVATPHDVAKAVVFAASDDAAMISGSAIVVDGAQLAGPPAAHFA